MKLNHLNKFHTIDSLAWGDLSGSIWHFVELIILSKLNDLTDDHQRGDFATVENHFEFYKLSYLNLNFSIEFKLQELDINQRLRACLNFSLNSRQGIRLWLTRACLYWTSIDKSSLGASYIILSKTKVVTLNININISM